MGVRCRAGLPRCLRASLCARPLRAIAALALLGALLASLVAHGATASDPEAVRLQRLKQGLQLEPQLQMLRDPRAILRAESLIAGGEASAWQPMQQSQHLGGEQVLWLRVRLEQADAHGHWLLAMPTTALSEVTLYGPYNAAGRALRAPQQTGLEYPFSTRPLDSERVVFPIDLGEPGNYQLLLRIRADYVRVSAPRVWHPADFLADRRHKAIFDGICYGILGTLLIYNLALLTTFRDRAYMWYVLACASALLALSTYNGHAAHYLWPEHPWLIKRSYVLFPSLWIAFSTLFARRFLDLPRHSVVLDRLVLGLATLPLGVLALEFAGHSALAQRVEEAIGVSGALIMTAIALLLWRRGVADALWYLAAQGMLFIAVIGLVLIGWGFVEAPFVLANALQIGVAGEMVVLATALSVRIRRVQQEQTLLRVRAAELARAAATDPLTGLANRSGLAQGARILLREGHSSALLLVDLNKFKAINDEHGHAAGDQVLCAIAARLQTQFRDTDVVARTGGDEFVVLLAKRPPDDTLELTLQRVAQSLTEPIRFQQQSLAVSASIGIAHFPEHGNTLDALMRHADHAMYAAKREGGGHRLATVDQ